MGSHWDDGRATQLSNLVVVVKADGIYDTGGRLVGTQVDTVVADYERRFGIRPILWQSQPPLRARLDAATQALLNETIPDL
ncbi:MAG: hypothetical protein CMM50_05480 [Rhodospirillaceae bacterium]|nr:hypothetical protein [Rhodospirillaceae bacterium]